MVNQPEGAHTFWKSGFDAMGDNDDEISMSRHRMAGKAKGRSGQWEVRFPNDKYVSDEGVTLEHMREQGAV